MLTITYPEGGERRNRIYTEGVMKSQYVNNTGDILDAEGIMKFLLRSKRVNKSSLKNFCEKFRGLDCGLLI